MSSFLYKQKRKSLKYFRRALKSVKTLYKRQLRAVKKFKFKKSGHYIFLSSFRMRREAVVMSLVALLIAGLFSQAVHAVWNGTSYDPGETLNPECLPTDVDCDVLPFGIGGTIPGGSAGSVLFVQPDEILAQDNANFLWDPANNQLQIGPSAGFDGDPQIQLSISNDFNSYAGIYNQNASDGDSASTDYIFGADNDGVDLVGHFGDLGILGSNFDGAANPSFNGMEANDIYLYGSGGNLILGTDAGVAGKVIKFLVGGLTTGDEIASFTSTGLEITAGGGVSGLKTDLICSDSTTSKLYTDGSGTIVCGTDQTGGGSGNVVDSLAETLGSGNDAVGLNIVNVGNLGLGGVSAPSAILSLGGTSARTILMERNTTADTAGQGLTLSSGGSTAGDDNLAGGDLTLKSGISTGTGTSAIRFFTATAGSAGNFDNATTEKMTILGNGNVGVGDTTPDYLFDVAGTAGFDGLVTAVGFSGPLTGNVTGNVSGSAGSVTGLSVTSGKTLTVANSLSLSGTDSTTMTFPSTSATLARTDGAQTFTGAQTFSSPITLASTGSGVTALTIPNSDNGSYNFVIKRNAATSASWELTTGASNFGSIAIHGGNSQVAIQNNAALGFSSSTAIGDTGLSRVSAGVVGVGTGAAGNTAGTLIAANMGIGTTAPGAKLTVVGASQANSNDSTHFSLTTGTGSATDERLAFGVHNGDYSWIQAVKPGTAFRVLALNPNSGGVTIGTTSSLSRLDVNGSVGIGSYAGVSAAPTNGLIVSGAVGIGRADPTAKFEITGSVASATVATEEIFKLSRLLNPVTSYPQVASFSLGSHASNGPGNGYGPSTRFDINLKSLAVDNVVADLTVMTMLSTGNVGIGDTTPDALLDVKGTVCLDLNADEACTDNTAALSDARLKTNVTDYEDGLSAIRILRPVRFSWNGENNTGTADSLGFLAQDVEEIFPELVITDTAGYKNLDYSKLVAVLADGIQELDLNLESIATPLDFENKKSFADRFFARISAWLADAGNGVTSMFANTFRATEQLCINDTCVTEAQLQALLENADMDVADNNNSAPEEEVEEVPVEEETVVDEPVTPTPEQPVEEIPAETPVEIPAEEPVNETPEAPLEEEVAIETPQPEADQPSAEGGDEPVTDEPEPVASTDPAV